MIEVFCLNYESTNFTTNGEITLEFPDQPESELLYALQFIIDNTEDESPYETLELSEVSQTFWATSLSNIGITKSAELIKIERDSIKPLPKLPQYTLKLEAMQGQMLTVKFLISQRLSAPCISPCNIFFLMEVF